jgi:flagellar basal-body rod protein FlgB
MADTAAGDNENRFLKPTGTTVATCPAIYCAVRRRAMAGDINMIGIIEAGIRAEGARQKAIASNLANMNAPGYRRSDVRFEELLSKALKSNNVAGAARLEPEFYQPMTTAVDVNGNDVSLDGEVGEMVKNSLRHRAYMEILKAKYNQMKQAIQF